MYRLQVFSLVWDVSNSDVEQRRFPAFTRGDNQKLQVLQNKVMRLKTNLPLGTPTAQLAKVTGDLTIQQLTALSTLTTAQKVLVTKQPLYLSKKFQLRTRADNQSLQSRQENTIRIQSHLSISRGGFFCRSAALFNSLPPELRSEKCSQKFKTKAKQWVQMNVALKPG